MSIKFTFKLSLLPSQKLQLSETVSSLKLRTKTGNILSVFCPHLEYPAPFISIGNFSKFEIYEGATQGHKGPEDV